ncbi:uncharacterized protein LOC119683397 [Teleopsis dalmanni]|uniref:uncharacterized protein LOC119677087 n=1 Tax=Teleopsis dalmanni TaxID=139649 RepID=UPI0018CFD169|nr:uncharacterized protein LOC119677087 [Teleopsis dalmanni]XP_037952988.1 uncharacterized protein LOC119683397 [Teleopsis dalmanni]
MAHVAFRHRCGTNCQHKECRNKNKLGFVDKTYECKCLTDLNTSSLYLENLIDMAKTLAEVMKICGIHDCKADSTVDTVTYMLLNYDEVCYCVDVLPRKRLRKEDLFHELGRKCLMNRVEAHLAYAIIKRGFKGFYYKPSFLGPNETMPLTCYTEQTIWIHVAKRIAEHYCEYNKLPIDEALGFEAKIKNAFKRYYERKQDRRKEKLTKKCTCCFCNQKQGHLIFTKDEALETYAEPDVEKEDHRCPHCCKRKARPALIHSGRSHAKCMKCYRAKIYCICPKYDFNLNYVGSIWNRPDFANYYETQIVAAQRAAEAAECDAEELQRYCADWNDPPWLRFRTFKPLNTE